MEKESIRLDQSMLMALDAARRMVREAFMTERELLLSEVAIDAEASMSKEGVEGETRKIKIDLVIQDPGQDGWLSLVADCEMEESEEFGIWIPCSVELWHVGSEWKRKAVFHPKGSFTIYRDGTMLISGPLPQWNKW